MADIVDSSTRSRMMAGIKGKDTKPELEIRKKLFSLGYRYRLHDKKLPGKPDLIFPQYRCVIFVNGCFWHAHGCHLFKWPKTKKSFWRKKINSNKDRDRLVHRELIKQHWRVLQIWECALKGKTKISIDVVISKTCKWIRGKEPFAEISGESGYCSLNPDEIA